MLTPILRLLIDRGADLNAVSDFGESALSVATNMGRFDAVGLPLDVGADPSPLGWTPVMRAVVLGSVAVVCSRIVNGEHLAVRGRWERTSWPLRSTDRRWAKAEALLAAGAATVDRGRCGKMLFMYPIGTVLCLIVTLADATKHCSDRNRYLNRSITDSELRLEISSNRSIEPLSDAGSPNSLTRSKVTRRGESPLDRDAGDQENIRA
jgi:ankyrin repeat protein